MADEVLTSREGAVLTITLNRPDVYNAINRAMHEGLAAALADAADPAIRAVVLTGAGRGFCAGQDLREFQELPGGVREALEADVPPERPGDSCAREARARGDQRRLRRRRAVARVRLRRPGRLVRRHLRARLHRDRPRPRRGRNLVHPSSPRIRQGVRVDGLEPPPERGRGARRGDSSPRRSRPPSSPAASRSAQAGTRHFRRGAWR